MCSQGDQAREVVRSARFTPARVLFRVHQMHSHYLRYMSSMRAIALYQGNLLTSDYKPGLQTDGRIQGAFASGMSASAQSPPLDDDKEGCCYVVHTLLPEQLLAVEYLTRSPSAEPPNPWPLAAHWRCVIRRKGSKSVSQSLRADLGVCHPIDTGGTSLPEGFRVPQTGVSRTGRVFSAVTHLGYIS